ncbi:MAG: hypothetical protein VCE75_12335 [Alphaproteobacteria bacterium]|jgi:NADPH:quinone reductase-like Zn-dependent oxidoreductase
MAKGYLVAQIDVHDTETYAKCTAQTPDNVSFAQGAAIGIPYGTAYRALIQRCRIEDG